MKIRHFNVFINYLLRLYKHFAGQEIWIMLIALSKWPSFITMLCVFENHRIRTGRVVWGRRVMSKRTHAFTKVRERTQRDAFCILNHFFSLSPFKRKRQTNWLTFRMRPCALLTKAISHSRSFRLVQILNFIK